MRSIEQDFDYHFYSYRFSLEFFVPESCEPDAFDCPNDAQCIEDVLAGGNE